MASEDLEYTTLNSFSTEYSSPEIFVTNVNPAEVKIETKPSVVAVGGVEEINLVKLPPEDVEVYLWNHPLVPRGIEIKANRITGRGYMVLPRNDSSKAKEAQRAMEELLTNSGGTVLINSWIQDGYGFGNGYWTLVPNKAETKILMLQKEHPVFFRIARYPVESPKVSKYRTFSTNSSSKFANNFNGPMKIDPVTRQPKAYTQVKHDVDQKTMIPFGKEIPADRVAHLKFDTWGDEVEGISVIQYMYPVIKYLINIEEAAAHTTWRNGFTQKKVNTDITTERDLRRMAKNIDALSVKDVILLPKGTDVTNLIPGTTQFVEIHEAFMKEVSIKLGIPLPILTLDGTCYTEDTETLTDSGWKFWWEISSDDQIAVFNKDTNEILYEYPKDAQLYYYSGTVFEFDNKVTNFKVTPNHNILWKPYTENAEYRVNKAEDIDNEYVTVKTNGVFAFNQGLEFFEIPAYHSKMYDVPSQKFKANDFVKFLGWYLSEGCSIYGQVRITQNVGENSQEIQNILDDLRLDYTIYEDKRRENTSLTFRIKNIGLSSWLSTFGKRSFEKTLPKELLHCNKQQIEAFLACFIKGDGSVSKTGHVSIFSSSKPLIDDLQRLLFLLGRKTSLKKYTDTRHNGTQTTYCISVHKNHKNETILPYDDCVSTEQYNGYVYCFETSTGFFVTRRNGKIAIQGNSTNKATTDTLEKDMYNDLRADELKIKQTIEEQVFVPACKMLFGDDFTDIPVFDFNFIEEGKNVLAERNQTIATTVKTLSDAAKVLIESSAPEELIAQVYNLIEESIPMETENKRKYLEETRGLRRNNSTTGKRAANSKETVSGTTASE